MLKRQPAFDAAYRAARARGCRIGIHLELLPERLASDGTPLVRVVGWRITVRRVGRGKESPLLYKSLIRGLEERVEDVVVELRPDLAELGLV